MVNPPPPDTAAAAPRQWSVWMGADGTCQVASAMDCPEGVTCNPPPPAPIACPAGLAAGGDATIVSDPATGACVVQLAVSCPPNTMCNPPRPQPVACPE
jgi:hypothetical protein